MGALASALTPARRAAAAALDLLLPPRCPGCGAITSTQGSLCATCWMRLQPLPEPACESCAQPLPAYAAASLRCLGCLADPPRWQAARAPYLYAGLARELVLGLKHSGREHLALPMARAMATRAAEWLAEGDLPVAVPLHRSRLAARGFNQAALLARVLAPDRFDPDLLRRTRDTGSTRGLGRAARMRSLSGAFAVPPAGRAKLKGRNVLLIDDVLTSGATARACVAALHRAGVARVRVLVYARVARDRDDGAAAELDAAAGPGDGKV